jgi:F-type H+-transporting ATPase subunit O
LIENKRVDTLEKCVEKYIEYYKILNKEENIRIISASDVSAEQKKKIEEALKKSNQGVTFKLTYEVNYYDYLL